MNSKRRHPSPPFGLLATCCTLLMICWPVHAGEECVVDYTGRAKEVKEVLDETYPHWRKEIASVEALKIDLCRRDMVKFYLEATSTRWYLFDDNLRIVYEATIRTGDDCEDYEFVDNDLDVIMNAVAYTIGFGFIAGMVIDAVEYAVEDDIEQSAMRTIRSLLGCSA